MLKIVNEHTHTNRHTHAHAYKLWSFDKTRKHSVGRSLVAFCGFCCCCSNLKATKGKPKQAHGEKRWVLTYLWFLYGLLCVCVCCVYTYVCVCVLGYPINIIIISSCKHLTFLLSYLPCHLPEQILLIALALALAFRLFSSSSLLSVCVMRCHLSLFSFFDKRPHSSPSLALFSVASWQWFLTFHARLFRAIFFYFSSLFFPFLFSAWG